MEIGEKIRQLRLSKLITQADLAGDKITRNMLSSIEHGTALPSLPTAIYIASRLGVPVGYLFAGEDEELFYRKMSAMPNARSAFAAGDLAGCLSILRSSFGDGGDDEIMLMRAECELMLARRDFLEGHLRTAAAGLDAALRAAARTVYSTAWLRARATVYFRYLATISPSLTSDVLDGDEIENAFATGDEICDYFGALLALEAGHADEVEMYLRQAKDSVHAHRIRVLELLAHEQYKEALEACEALLAREDLTMGVLMYEVFGDMELCCRKNDDYKRAYEFGSARMGLMERLLAEF